ncbi:MAG: uroporphyrinogen-III C-methyltransferase [Cyclobacteriaceae bacterium]|nr:uroporphyrinogen-III C-methyltransferase [Cyclobacteriaceae bacterium]
MTGKRGLVILAGAGPGDPELITLKAIRYLNKADVVVVDRLVSADLITKNTRQKALIIPVGKQARKEESTAQADIDNLLVTYALQNKLVVRLKGGDVSFFSNVLDELKALTENEIPFEIIPGVTAASGASTYAGIPLTARGYAASVRFLTCYKPEEFKNSYWNELANTEDTLVFYMSSDSLPMVAENLTNHRIANDKLLAIIEQATTPFQKVSIFNLYEYTPLAPQVIYKSPTLIIIGRVVGLHKQFQWKSDFEGTNDYFGPLVQRADKQQPV